MHALHPVTFWVLIVESNFEAAFALNQQSTGLHFRPMTPDRLGEDCHAVDNSAGFPSLDRARNPSQWVGKDWWTT